MGDNDTWAEWSKYVLMELKRCNQQIGDLETKIDKLNNEQLSQLKIEIAMLKVKASVWGLMGGAIPVIILLIREMTK